jgi:hypothetical protein
VRGTGEREIGKRNREKGREEGRGREIFRDKYSEDREHFKNDTLNYAKWLLKLHSI